MFHCTNGVFLNDRDLGDLVPEDIVSLVRLRMEILRERGRPLRSIELPFLREDGTWFLAEVRTEPAGDPGEYQSTLHYLMEVKAG